ncbi:MAG: hypothetical protein OXT69_00940 [Candidatus Poribacteria bacterium]|nr:hypothetical protein [Candidatus Poribacteria bacterium]
MRSRQMARYVLTGLALAMLGLLPPAGQTDGLLSPTEKAVEPLTTPAEKVDGPLRFRLQEGDLFAYRSKLKYETTANTPIGTIKEKYEIDSVIEQRVVEVAENGNGIIETKYKEFDVAVGLGGSALSGVPQERIDQAQEELTRLATELSKPILNEPYKVTMTPRGEIKKVDAKEFLAAVESIEVPAGLPFNIKDWFTEESLKINRIAPGLVFPKLEEYIWKSEMKVVEKMQDQSLTTDVKLDWSRQGDKVVKQIPSHILEFTGSGKLADGTASLQIEGVDIAVNMESFDMEGTVHVSKEDLWPVKTKIVNSGVLSMTGEQCGSIQTVTVQMKQTGTSERLRPDEYEQF